MNRGAWWFIVRGIAKSWTQLKRLGTYAHLDHLSRPSLIPETKGEKKGGNKAF